MFKWKINGNFVEHEDIISDFDMFNEPKDGDTIWSKLKFKMLRPFKRLIKKIVLSVLRENLNPLKNKLSEKIDKINSMEAKIFDLYARINNIKGAHNHQQLASMEYQKIIEELINSEPIEEKYEIDLRRRKRPKNKSE